MDLIRVIPGKVRYLQLAIMAPWFSVQLSMLIRRNIEIKNIDIKCSAHDAFLEYQSSCTLKIER